jgi:ABC-type lipoprotein export system ATPase subunit/bifunctional DNA-binding transcriptional regulator/antitoxin component of YhaV-PrlF toxin-antitoxin module
MSDQHAHVDQLEDPEATQADNHFILCEGLVKIFQVADLEMVALQGLNLTVDKGELVGIVGASGSGKSTLMNILGGLDRPTAGRVRVDGNDLLKMPDRQLNKYRREKVGFVWQQSTRNLVPYLNAVRNVMLPMTLNGVTGSQKKRHAEELLEIVGLGERMHHHLPELSGGEQQRVAIAVALANNPTLLLADEPTGEVDSATAKTIYRTFQTLTRELSITTLIVSHDPGIARHVDRVVAIRDGMLASETIRQARLTQNGDAGSEGQPDDQEHNYAELVVLDRAGRIHVPQEYLEHFAIKGRAQLEITEDGILIRPTEHTRTEQVKIESAGGGEATAVPKLEHTGAMTVKRKRGLFGRLGRKDRT